MAWYVVETNVSNAPRPAAALPRRIMKYAVQAIWHAAAAPVRRSGGQLIGSSSCRRSSSAWCRHHLSGACGFNHRLKQSMRKQKKTLTRGNGHRNARRFVPAPLAGARLYGIDISWLAHIRTPSLRMMASGVGVGRNREAEEAASENGVNHVMT